MWPEPIEVRQWHRAPAAVQGSGCLAGTNGVAGMTARNSPIVCRRTKGESVSAGQGFGNSPSGKKKTLPAGGTADYRMAVVS